MNLQLLTGKPFNDILKTMAFKLCQILLGYPRFNRANAIKPLAWLRLRPYDFAC